MAQPAIAADITQTLYVQMGLGAQHPFDHILVFEYLTHTAYLVFGPLFGLDERIDLGFGENFPCARASDPENGGQRKFTALLRWYVYSCNSWHNSVCLGLPLPLLVPRILLVDDIDAPFAADNLVIDTALLNTGLDFHNNICVSVYLYLWG